jgi:16S rRNA (guanine527-N7)-methyltransferase
MDFLEFWTLCSANGIVLDENQREMLQRYTKELIYWNQKVNMISRKDEENVWVRHIMHSLAPLKYIKLPHKARCLDFGAGGGLPGIPLAIATDKTRFTIVDSIKKKYKMIDMFAQHTGIKDLMAVHSRVEELADGKHYYRSFDYIFARAVARTNKLLSWTKDLAKPNATWVFLKGGDLTEEISEAKAEHPDIKFELTDIEFFGVDWFTKENKKLLVCKRR